MEIKNFLTIFNGRDNAYLYADSPEVRSRVRTYISKFKNSYGEIRLPQNGDIELENLFTQLCKFDADCEDELKTCLNREYNEFYMGKKIKIMETKNFKIHIPFKLFYDTVFNSKDVCQFKRKLGFTIKDYAVLNQIILNAVDNTEPIFEGQIDGKNRYVLVFSYESVIIETIWVVENNMLRLISCKAK